MGEDAESQGGYRTARRSCCSREADPIHTQICPDPRALSPGAQVPFHCSACFQMAFQNAGMTLILWDNAVRQNRGVNSGHGDLNEMRSPPQ